jgi:hypothetical protein
MSDIKILDEEIQKILVFEYFYLKKDPETISRIFDIPVLDLKYFFYSVEAHALFKKYENEFKDWPVPETLEQLRNFLIDTFKVLLVKAEGKDAAELIDKGIPRIINLFRGENTPITNNVQMIGSQQVNILEDNRSFMPFNIDYIKPKLLTEEELALIPGVKNEIEDGAYESQ